MGCKPCPGEAELAEARLAPEQARRAICHPDPSSPLCGRLLAELRRLRLTPVSYGDVEPVAGGPRILGRGWTGNVFLALSEEHGLVAVKALRPGSRRRSMLWEAAAWAVAAAAGAAPRLLEWSRLLIVYRPVLGPMLAEYRENSMWLVVLDQLLVKVFALDTVGLSHNELARPGGQVVIDCCSSVREPYIVDYDSATLPPSGASNLTQLLGGLPRAPLYSRCRALPARLRGLLASYKRAPGPETFREIRSGVAGYCEAMLSGDT